MIAMAKELRHYRVLREQLEKFTDDITREKILNGMDYVKESSSPETKAQWAYEAVRRMDETLDSDTCIKIRENCTCLKSNENSIYAKTFRKLRKQYKDEDNYIDEVIKYLNDTKPLRRCGKVSRKGNRIFSVIGEGKCSCPTIREGLKRPISVTWCHCCKGSLLSVYRYVFPDKTCKMEIIESVAAGGKTCKMVTMYD
jgi:DNA integrity scanning protein DisA with diadenylate cyclase activity